MRFALTDEQIEFRDAVRGLLADTCGPEDVRAAWADAELAGGGPGGGQGRVPAAWSALAEMGVLGITVPEEHGGLAMTDEDLVPLLIEVGRSGLPDPVVSTASVAVGALRDVVAAGDPSGAAAPLLARIAAGEVAVGVAFVSADVDEVVDTGAGAVAVVGAPAVDAVATSPFVASAESLDVFLLFADGQIHLVDRAAVQLEPVESVDGARHLAAVSWDAADATVLLDGSAGVDATGRAFDRAALGAAALLVGLSRTMTEMTVLYATERQQFGVPIGSFQAVKHHLADATLPVEFAEPLVLRAANSLALGDPDASVHVSMAKAKASDAAKAAGAASLQVHGAIGYTVECDLHLYLKRAWALAAEHGDAEFHRRRVRAGVVQA